MLRLGTLYARSRLVPAAFAMMLLGALSLWTFDVRDPRLVVVAISLGAGVAAVGLGGADVQLERTGAIPWMVWRFGHLAGIVLVLTGVLFHPEVAWFVLRDVGGLTGLASAAATVIGSQLAWIVPVAWTTVGAVFPLDDDILLWMMQEPDSRTAAVVAGILSLGGALVYVVRGPRG